MERLFYYILGFMTLIMLIIYTKLWSKISKKSKKFMKRTFSSGSIRAKKELAVFSKRLEKNMDKIESLYQKFVDSEGKSFELPNSVEWVFDNYYSIQEKEKAIIDEGFRLLFFSLFRYQYTSDNSKIRIYDIAKDIVNMHEGRVSDTIVVNYLENNQKHAILSERELDILPKMILIALIENIAQHSEELLDIYREWESVSKLVSSQVEDELIINKTLTKMLKDNAVPNTHFITRLYDVLRENGELNDITYNLIIGLFNKIGTEIDEIINRANNKEVNIGLITGNLITSLKEESFIDWGKIQSDCSFISDVLKLDPASVYSRMSLDTQVLYRDKVVELSEKSKLSEVKVANIALALAQEAYDTIDDDNIEKLKMSHVGYYFIDEGQSKLKEELKTEGLEKYLFTYNPSLLVKKRIRMYIGLIGMISFMLLCFLVLWNPLLITNSILLNLILTSMILIVPISEIAITIVNHLSLSQTKPHIFPSLSLKEGIPQEMRTLIVIPALIPNIKAAKKIVKQLEQHYLLNREDNLFFAIVGAFKDADKEHLESDQEILTYTNQQIDLLNDIHGEKFYLLQRKRVYNKSNDQWIGWERKRGAITELNEFLLGSKSTSFIYPQVIPENIKSIKYVITLDSDTVLPIQAAKNMIAILEHPLNQPVIDPELNIVTKGYALLQPNIATDIQSAFASLFSRIFNVQLGFSPYSRRSSNLYQDFFKQGIFMGKGIYNLEVFEKILGHTFPENRILSHDLLEGAYLRTAFTSDLNLIDDFPQSYILDASRQYRWVRGDWQLLPYLRRHVLNFRGEKIKNPLSTLSKWQILDNLRRSLLAPSLILLIFLSSAGLLKHNQEAMLFVVVVSFVEMLKSLLFLPYRIVKNPKDIKTILNNLWISFWQNIMNLVYLPYQAWRKTQAIVITLTRLLVTKQNLLQWTTSSAMGMAFNNTVSSHFLDMFASLVQIIFLIYIYQNGEPYATSLFTALVLLWLSAPIFAYVTGLDLNPEKKTVPIEHKKELGRIARKTYLYFETFSNRQNNYLVPDNYQESPLKSVDSRTSPTNIGFGLCADITAFDFGYIELDSMFSKVNATLKTISKLPKWQGHLFNWYNTKTLDPMTPIYISTVDSGNFVGYLLVVKEGLKEGIEQVVDFKKFTQGLKDTVACINNDGYESLIELVNQIDADASIDSIMFEIHPQFKTYFDEVSEKDSWLERIKKQVNGNYNAYHTYYPFMNHLSEMPEELINLDSKDPVKILIGGLKEWKSLSDGIDLYLISAQLIESLMGEREFATTTLVWLNKLSLILFEAAELFRIKHASYLNIIETIDTLYNETNFNPLYDEKKKLLSIGFDLETETLSNSYYDLMASEARQASYISIAKGDVPSEHWSSLGRTMGSVGKDSGLLSWTGTMFEYLMPMTIMKSYRHTILEKSQKFALKTQIKYGEHRSMPWGVSESQYFAFDSENKYQYKAIGVPWLAISKKIVDTNVVAPYASFLGLMVGPLEALKNIERLKKDGLEGIYGFYEAVEYEGGLRPLIVKSYMAHHQGMSLVSINNYLHDNIMQKRFDSDHAMQAYDLLLQEMVPSGKPLVRSITKTEPEVLAIKAKQVPAIRNFSGVNLKLPKVHLMSNGNYSVLLSDKGTGYSKIRNADITRWREDKIMDNYGMFFIIDQVNSKKRYSATYAPLNIRPDYDQIIFESSKSTFIRTDGKIETKLEVVIPYEDNVEIRQLTFKNNGESDESIVLTSYFEPILTKQSADRAHKAFSNLFIETETDPDKNCIIARRRVVSDNSEQMNLAFRVITPKGENIPVVLQSDRNKVLERNTSMQDFKMTHSNEYYDDTPGAVLDPVVSTQTSFKLEPKKSITLWYVTMVSENRQTLDTLINKYQSPDDMKYALIATHNHEQISSKYAFLSEKDIELYQNTLSHLIYISPLKQEKDARVRVVGGKRTLWKFGISGDYPIVTIMFNQENQMKLLIELLHAQQYWKMLNFKVDLVLIDMSPYSYQNTLSETMSTIINKHTYQTIFTHPCTIITLQAHALESNEIEYLLNSSRLVLDGKFGTLSKQLVG